jgi:hypothetical protein
MMSDESLVTFTTNPSVHQSSILNHHSSFLNGLSFSFELRLTLLSELL